MKNFISGLMIGAACVFTYLNHAVGNYDEMRAGIACIEHWEPKDAPKT